MLSPIFLSRDEVILLHSKQIERYGGSDGIRDVGLLEAAVSMPQQAFGGEYVHGDVPSMAAAYLFHLVKNHPFIDGNKWIGAFASDVFLLTNGLRLTLSAHDFTETVLAVATSQLSKDALIELFRANVQPIEK